MVIPDKAGPGVFMLQNGEWAGLHIAIKSHKVQAVSPCRSSVDTHVAIVLAEWEKAWTHTSTGFLEALLTGVYLRQLM